MRLHGLWKFERMRAARVEIDEASLVGAIPAAI